MKLLACSIVFLALALTGCDAISKPAPRQEDSQVQCRLAELAAIKAQSEAQLELQKRLAAIQLDVAKRCADRGGIPVIFNGNVDCKVTK